MSLRPPELSSNYGNMVKLQLKKKLEFSASFAADSPAPTEKPEIELEFIGVITYTLHFHFETLLQFLIMIRILGFWQPKAESETAKAISGEKLLRNIMLDNKIELYATYVSVFFFLLIYKLHVKLQLATLNIFTVLI